MKRWNLMICFIVFIVAVVCLSAEGTTHYVKVDGNDNADGHSWDTAFATIQKGIDSSTSDGDIVIVADGTYTGTGNRDIRFKGKKITVRSQNGPATCVIDCQGTASDQHRGFTFLIGDKETLTSVLDGFTITNGYAKGGGGIWCETSPTIRNCRVVENVSQAVNMYFTGGGIYIGRPQVPGYLEPQPLIEKCEISWNRSNGAGGGIRCYFGSPTIRNCVISHNESCNSSRSTEWFGGGVYSGPYASGSVIVENCVIAENWGSSGIYLINGNVLGCTVVGNNTYDNNSRGGGIYIGGTGTIHNSVVWGNLAATGQQLCVAGSTTNLTVSYSDIQDGQSGVTVLSGTLNWGSGNINDDPLFEDDGYHLTEESPCINAGDPSGNYTGQVDIDGGIRVRRSRIDIGADEAKVYWYVDKAATGAETGWTLEDAFTTIQAGIDAAEANDGDEVVVAPGTYSEAIVINGKAITVRSTNPNDWSVVESTIIDGTGYIPSGWTTGVMFFSVGRDCVLDGFTICNWSGVEDCGLILGGAIYSDGSPTIRHCVVRDNVTNDNPMEPYLAVGIGLFSDSGSPKINNCVFAHNIAGTSCSEGYGAGLYLSAGSPEINDCLIYGNIAVGDSSTQCGGGGIYIDYSNANIINCTIADNVSYSNSFDGVGGGIYVTVNTPVVPIVQNCILWGNMNHAETSEATQIYVASGTPDIDYTCVQYWSGTLGGTGNHGDDPNFSNPANHDYHLENGSACIDAGNVIGIGDYDINNEPRINGSAVDMGADEADPVIDVDPNGIEVTLFEGDIVNRTLTIFNRGGTDLIVKPTTRITEEITTGGEGLLLMSSGGGSELNANLAVAEENTNQIILSYSFDSPVMSQSDGYDLLTIQGLSSYERTGAPLVPVRPVRFLVPAGKEVDTIRVIGSAPVTIKGKYLLKPGERPVPVNEIQNREKAQPDPQIYGSSSPWPGIEFETIGVMSKGQYRIGYVNLFPLRYIPASGKIDYAETMYLVVTLKDESKKTPTVRRVKNSKIDKQIEKEIAGSVDNPKAIYSYRNLSVDLSVEPAQMLMLSGGSACMNLDPGPYEYIVITDEYMMEAPDPNFQTLCDSKIRRGISARIVTTEWIDENYDPDIYDPNRFYYNDEGTRNASDKAIRIRMFVMDAYQNWGTQYVLLGGAFEYVREGETETRILIPVRLLCDQNNPTNYQQMIPSDMYYGCITPPGTFDLNHDGYYGTPNDVNGTDVDLIAEVYIGRASVRDYSDLANFIQKTLYYASGQLPRTYLPRVSMLAEDGTNGIPSCHKADLETIRLGTDQTIGFENHQESDIYEFDTSQNLYDFDYNHTAQWSADDFFDLANAEVHVFHHLGHSSALSIGHIYVYPFSTFPDHFTNDAPFFIFSEGCNPGEIDFTYYDNGIYLGCMAEQITNMEHGAFAAIMNSRTGIFGTGTAYSRQYYDAILGPQRILELGRALQDCKDDMLWDNSSSVRHIRYTLNLFGDPEQILRVQDIDPWLTFDNSEITIPSSNNDVIQLTVDASIQSPGSYQTELKLRSNDPDVSVKVIPITMTVIHR